MPRVSREQNYLMDPRRSRDTRDRRGGGRLSRPIEFPSLARRVSVNEVFVPFRAHHYVILAFRARERGYATSARARECPSNPPRKKILSPKLSPPLSVSLVLTLVLALCNYIFHRSARAKGKAERHHDSELPIVFSSTRPRRR